MRSILFSLLFLFSFQISNATEKEWTFLVYINGHNNLDSYGKGDINEMEQVGSTDQVNVVVQWATYSQNTKRLYITKDSNTSKVTSPVAVDLGKKVDMGIEESLVDFITWGVKNYPAKKYFVTVWNHGSGWHDKVRQLVTRSISSDDIYGSDLDTLEYAEAIRTASKQIGQKLDIVGNDACLMSMPEVSYEMSDSVQVYIGSVDLEPADGWPYDAFLNEWSKTPTLTSQEVARLLSQLYVASYTKGSQGNEEVTLSAFDLAHSDTFNSSLNSLSVELKSTADKAAITQALVDSPFYYYSDYRDFGHFVKLIESKNLLPNSKALSDVKSALNAFVIANEKTMMYQTTTGVSMWMPTSKGAFNSYANQYHQLSFEKATSWAEALGSLF